MTIEETREHYRVKAAVQGVPEHTIGGLVRYIVDGIPPGDFLQAVLTNDLMGAFGRADEENGLCLRHICNFLYNDAPAVCFGSEEKMVAWMSAIAAEKKA